MNLSTHPQDPFCPCGCGKTLGRYNGKRMLVCYATWQRAADRDRSAIMLPGSSLDERRKAARHVYELALSIRRARSEGDPCPSVSIRG